jgi:hypothetical protein
MSENKNAKTPADDGQPDAWCNGMPAYEGPLSKEQRKPLVQDLDAPLTLNGVPLYTAPQKQWVGLTDEEVSYCRYAATFCDELDTAYMAELIEQALKEKNHG